MRAHLVKLLENSNIGVSPKSLESQVSHEDTVACIRALAHSFIGDSHTHPNASTHLHVNIRSKRRKINAQAHYSVMSIVRRHTHTYVPCSSANHNTSQGRDSTELEETKSYLSVMCGVLVLWMQRGLLKPMLEAQDQGDSRVLYRGLDMAAVAHMYRDTPTVTPLTAAVCVGVLANRFVDTIERVAGTTRTAGPACSGAFNALVAHSKRNCGMADHSGFALHRVISYGSTVDGSQHTHSKLYEGEALSSGGGGDSKEDGKAGAHPDDLNLSPLWHMVRVPASPCTHGVFLCTCFGTLQPPICVCS